MSWTLSIKKKTITAKGISPLKRLEERKKLRFTVEMKDLVLHCLVRTSDTFLEVRLAKSLEWCGEKKDLKNQSLLNTLSAYTISWYTRTWLSTMSLGIRRPHCCVAFFLLQSSRLEILLLLHGTWTIRPLINFNSDRCLKILFIVFTLTWELRVVEKVHFVSVGITRGVFIFRKSSGIRF